MLPIVRALLTCLPVMFAAASANAATVRGVVTTAAGGSPLAGAVVAAYDAIGVLRGSTDTNVSGQYILTVPAGSYRVLAYDPTGTYATAFYNKADSFESSAFVQLADGSPLDVNFALPRGAVVNGSVSASNAPLPDAVVEAYNLSGTRRGFATADAAGQFSLVLPAGDYKLFAYDANGVFAGEFAVNVRAFADATPVRVDPAAPVTVTVTFVLDRAARLSGTLVDVDTRAPLSGKLVYAYTAAGALVAVTTTDAGGAYRFSLGPGQYRLVAGDPSRVYAPAFYVDSRSFEQADVLTLAAGEQRPNVTLAARRGAIITGRANAPVSVTTRLVVAAYNLDGTQHAAAPVNEAGEYTLVVAPGEYKVAVVDPAGTYATEFYAGRMTFAGARELTVIVGQTLTGIGFTPVRAGRFTGTVRDGATQQPLGGMTVAAYDAAGVPVAQTTSASDGTYRLSIAPGQYRLVAFDTRLDYATAYASGAASYEASVPIAIAADDVQVTDFAMRRGVRVTGTVRDESGAGIERVEVFALDATGNRVAGAMTSGDGAFALVVLSGTYTFTAIDPNHRYRTRSTPAPVTVGSTSPAPIAFTLPAVTRRRAARS